jgi:exopolysaccharide biosynthesis polyprenyl glycosylphosphotransferase
LVHHQRQVREEPWVGTNHIGGRVETMTLFFNPSPGTDWAGTPAVAAPEGRRTSRSLQVVGAASSARGTARTAARTWRAQFPAFRLRSILRDVALSAAAGAPLLLADATAFAWSAVPALTVPAAVAIAGGYRWRTLGEGAAETRVVLRAGTAVVFALVLAGYLGVLAVPALLAVGAAPAAVAATVVGRRVARRGVVHRRIAGGARYRTLVVGSAAGARAFLEQAAGAAATGYDVVGWVPVGERQPAPAGVADLGPLHDVADVAGLVAAHEVDVVLLVGQHDATTARRISWSLEGTTAALVVVPGVAEIGDARVRVRPTGDLWSVQLDVAHRPLSVAGKGLVDRVLGASLLAVAGLILVPVMIAVRLTSPGKALYKQQRIGRNGVPFTMWKVRSMYVDADARRAALLAQPGDGNGLLFKMRDDPRVTPIGRVLRRLSIDELPQLFNVVRGEMSIVGPRPALAEETSKYVGDEPRRLAVKPGLTGLWQVSGRSDLSRDESMRLDLRYVDNVSLGFDAAILGRTFRAVFRGFGAY